MQDLKEAYVCVLIPSPVEICLLPPSCHLLSAPQADRDRLQEQITTNAANGDKASDELRELLRQEMEERKDQVTRHRYHHRFRHRQYHHNCQHRHHRHDHSFFPR